MRTDGQTDMTTLNVAYSKVANMRKCAVIKEDSNSARELPRYLQTASAIFGTVFRVCVCLTSVELWETGGGETDAVSQHALCQSFTASSA
jgi:hypothetical protein